MLQDGGERDVMRGVRTTPTAPAANGCVVVKTAQRVTTSVEHAHVRADGEECFARSRALTDSTGSSAKGCAAVRTEQGATRLRAIASVQLAGSAQAAHSLAHQVTGVKGAPRFATASMAPPVTPSTDSASADRDGLALLAMRPVPKTSME